MELPKIGKSDRGMLEGIKSKLGFANNQSEDDYDDSYYEDQNHDYDEYDADYGPESNYHQTYGDDAQGGYVPASPATSRRSSYSDSRSDTASGPRLVSIDDVRSRTQVPESLNRDPLPQRHVSSSPSSSYPSTSSSGYRSNYPRPSRTVERASDYLLSTDTSDVNSRGGARSSGYDSLFSSTASAAAGISSSTPGSSAYDPYETFAGTGAASHNPSRSLSILKPVSYGEVERIAKIVKAGDVVVLSLRNTPDHLAKRILDFSFGVSSALDSSVECIADKVFVIIRGYSLRQEELASLRNQGVL